MAIALIAERMGFPYVEGGFPQSNAVDRRVFEALRERPLKGTKHAAFGMTRRAGIAANEDAGLRALVDSGAPAITVVGKSSRYQVENVLRTTVEENIAMIRDSVAFLRVHSDDVTYDAEHFFDAWKEDRAYAIHTLRAAQETGARRLVLCDTNGGSIPGLVAKAVRDVRKEFSDIIIGIHPHDDRDLAMANMLAAVDEGATHVQGTWNGHGERVGNLDLAVAIPNLDSEGYKTISSDALASLTSTAHEVARIQRQRMDPRQAFVGKRVARHKGGMHISAVGRTQNEDGNGKNAYEFFDPSRYGNEGAFVASKQGGAAFIAQFTGEARLLRRDQRDRLRSEKPLQGKIMEKIKAIESLGFSIARGPASLELLMLKSMEDAPRPFTVIERPKIYDAVGADADATVKILSRGDEVVSHTVGAGKGTVNAMFLALIKGLQGKFPDVRNVSVVDFDVEKLQGSDQSSASAVQVAIQFFDGDEQWATTSASEDMLEASWNAIVDGLEWKILRMEAKRRVEI